MTEFTPDERAACERLARLAIHEDLGTVGDFKHDIIGPGDITSSALIPTDLQGQGVFVARTAGVIAGLPAVPIVCALFDGRLQIDQKVKDGASAQAGTQLAVVRGPMRSLLASERTALNFLQRLSGIATLTRKYVDAIAGFPCKILDTRKTTPGWRLLEKYAVRCGGGHNHRTGLYDGILIKDNHLAALGGGPSAVRKAIELAREWAPSGVFVEVEVDTLEQFNVALAGRPNIVLLDNMTTDQMREAVRRRNAAAPDVLLEASGGVNLQTVRAIAETGVDRISVGALTHSAPALDIALDYQHS